MAKLQPNWRDVAVVVASTCAKVEFVDTEWYGAAELAELFVEWCDSGEMRDHFDRWLEQR